MVTWVVTSPVTTCCLVTTHNTRNSMTLSFPDTVERWPLDRLIPHAPNARTHSEDQVAQIAASIAEFDFVNPVVGDEGIIVAGRGRVIAA